MLTICSFCDTSINALGYSIRYLSPKHINYRDHQVYSIPAPASGAVFMSALGVLGVTSPAEQGSVQQTHRMTEALKVRLLPEGVFPGPTIV